MSKLLTAGAITFPADAEDDTLRALLLKNVERVETSAGRKVIYNYCVDVALMLVRSQYSSIVGVPRRIVVAKSITGINETEHNVSEYLESIVKTIEDCNRSFAVRSSAYVDAVEGARKAQETAEQFATLFANIPKETQTKEMQLIAKSYETDATGARNKVSLLAEDLAKVITTYASAKGVELKRDTSALITIMGTLAVAESLDEALLTATAE